MSCLQIVGPDGRVLSSCPIKLWCVTKPLETGRRDVLKPEEEDDRFKECRKESSDILSLAKLSIETQLIWTRDKVIGKVI